MGDPNLPANRTDEELEVRLAALRAKVRSGHTVDVDHLAPSEGNPLGRELALHAIVDSEQRLEAQGADIDHRRAETSLVVERTRTEAWRRDFGDRELAAKVTFGWGYLGTLVALGLLFTLAMVVAIGSL